MRKAAVVLVALLLILAAWFASTAAEHDAPPTRNHDSESPDIPATATIAAPPTERRSERKLQRSAVAPDTTTPTPPAGAKMLRVRIVDATTMQPEPAAEIVWYDSSFDWNKLSASDRELQNQDLEKLLRLKANTAVTDSQGCATLPVKRWANLHARSGDRYASGVWRPDVVLATEPPFAGEFVLQLKPDRTLLVRAVDANRAPVANVIVQLQRTHRLASGSSAQSKQNLPPTNADGITPLRHAQETFAASDRIIAAELRARLSGDNGDATTIDLNALPDEPIDVVLPAFGSILVELLGPDGRPWPLPDSGSESVSLVAPDWKGGSLVRGINDQPVGQQGRATFAHVRCGLRFVLRGPSGWEQTDAFEGPTRHGEQIRVARRMPADAILVTGRLLESDHTPFVGHAGLRAESQRGSGNVALPRDATGSFCVPIPKYLAGATTVTVHQRGKGGVMHLQTNVTLRTPLAAGRNDIGDIVLKAAPLFVAGQVTIAGGNDPTGVLDSLQLEIESYDSGKRQRWEPIYVGAALDEERRFAIYDQLQGDRFRLVVHGDFVPLPPREFVPGTDDLKIEVSPGGSVTATFVPSPLSAWLVCRLAPESAPQDDRDWRRTRRAIGNPKRKDGQLHEIQWPGLKTGSYRFQIGCQGEDPLLDLLVHVPDGGAANDPRLLDIDLHNQLRLIRMKVTDAANDPLTTTSTIVLANRLQEGVTWYGQQHPANRDEGSVLALSRPTTLYVLAAGYRGTTATGVFADTTVALSPAPSVTLRWIDAPSLPEGVYATVMCSPRNWPVPGPQLRVQAGSSSRSGRASRILSGQSSSCTMVHKRAKLVAEAPYPLQMRLRLRKTGKPPQYISLQPNVIDPAQLTDGQAINVRADADALGAAIRMLTDK